MHRSLAVLVVAGLVLAAPAGAEGLKEVEDCVAKNLPAETSVQAVLLKAHDNTGGVRDMRATIWWKKGADGKSRVRLRITEPADMRGTGVLFVEQADRNDTFVYLPELKKVRRVMGQMMSGNLFGTDFTYEQLERLQGIAKEAGAERLPDAQQGGRDVYVVQSKPAHAEESEFTRVVAFIDKTTCVPLKIQFYGGAAEPRREVTSDPAKITKQGGGFVPGSVLAVDLQSGTQTELIVEKIEVGMPISDRQFSETALTADEH